MTDRVQFMNMHEAAKALGVTRRRIWQMVRDGDMEAITNPLDRREKLILNSEIRKFAKFVHPSKKRR